MNKPITIAVDAMGGENSPNKTIEGISLHSKSSSGIFYNIYGNKNIIDPLISKFKIPSDRFKIFHTENKIEDTDTALGAAKKGKDTSLWLAIESLKENQSDCVVSAGNTGALFVIAKLNLQMIENIDKPALSALWPHKNGLNVVLDLQSDTQSQWTGYTGTKNLSCSISSETVTSGVIGTVATGSGIYISQSGFNSGENLIAINNRISDTGDYSGYNLISTTTETINNNQTYSYSSGISFPFSASDINDTLSQSWVNILNSGLNIFFNDSGEYLETFNPLHFSGPFSEKVPRIKYPPSTIFFKATCLYFSTSSFEIKKWKTALSCHIEKFFSVLKSKTFSIPWS